jgi:hypothetical protein
MVTLNLPGLLHDPLIGPRQIVLEKPFPFLFCKRHPVQCFQLATQVLNQLRFTANLNILIPLPLQQTNELFL